jgi:hypothetical protein
LNALQTELIEAVQHTVTGLATEEDLRVFGSKATVNALMATVAETKEGAPELTGLMEDMLQALGATHEDVRTVRTTVTPLAQSDAAHEAAIESLRKRLDRVERKVGIAK